jgi:6-phosphogluconolactonase (cycloisomerase 2 family)
VHVVGDRVLTLDLGADAVHEHDLSMTRLRTVRLPAGTGPRDLLPLPDGRIAVLGELSGDVLTLSPALEVLHSARIPGFSDGDHAAALALVRERFVVTGVRGSDVLATLEVTDAGLEPVASVATAGRWPRHLVADGSVIHVANQLSSTVTSFSVDARGIPTLLGEPVAVPSPTCLAAVGGAANLW